MPASQSERQAKRRKVARSDGMVRIDRYVPGKHANKIRTIIDLASEDDWKIFMLQEVLNILESNDEISLKLLRRRIASLMRPAKRISDDDLTRNLEKLKSLQTMGVSV